MLSTIRRTSFIIFISCFSIFFLEHPAAFFRLSRFQKKILAATYLVSVYLSLFRDIEQKRAIYLLSLYPASALLCGLHVRDRWSWLAGNSKSKYLLKVFAFLLIILPLGAIVALFTLQDEIIALLRANPLIYVYLLLIFTTGILFLYCLVRKSEKKALFLLFTYLILAGFFHNSYYPCQR